MQGIITKGIGGFYYVLSEGEMYECKARGILRMRGKTPLAGDRVEISEDEGGTFTIDRILPRLNSFERPPVANVEMKIYVISKAEPMPNFALLDRMLVSGEDSGAELVICVSKCDLPGGTEPEEIVAVYSRLYPVFQVSVREMRGISELRSALLGKAAALSGPSGVGKSTLLNALLGEYASPTGRVSERTSRGRHTTRHTELFAGDGFYIFDTPGFSSFEIEDIEPARLQYRFPEFQEFRPKCRFDDCVHIHEPDCAVLEALRSGKIASSRYDSYADMYEFLKTREEAKY